MPIIILRVVFNWQPEKVLQPLICRKIFCMDNPDSFPDPSHSSRMPLPSIIAAIGMKIAGQNPGLQVGFYF